MNVSGIPFLGFGYKDNQRQDERKKKDFGEILQNEIKKKSSDVRRRAKDDVDDVSF
jgi:hypothetical protein